MRGLLTAFSIYSKIPVPKLRWSEKDMKYSLCFFPFVGAVIAAIMVGWQLLVEELCCENILRTTVFAAIPLIITGGFHVDGYMDTMDALHSYKSREDKLKILSDPHIGAFSVIMVILYYLLFIGFVSELRGIDDVILLGSGFVISRVFSGLMVIYLKPAKGDGMLKYFSDTAGRRVVTAALIFELIILDTLVTIFVSPAVLVETAVAVLFIGYYKYKTGKEFGGVTGDTAGYFVTVTELFMCMTVVIYGAF